MVPSVRVIAVGVTLLAALVATVSAWSPSTLAGRPDVVDHGVAMAPSGRGVHAVGGCPVFPADNWWNRRVDDRAVWRYSDRIVDRQAAGHAVHLDLGTVEEEYGIPVTVVPADQPELPLRFGVDGENYADESDPGPHPIPADAPIEGGTAAHPDPTGGDRHVIVVERGSCELVELYAATRVYGSGGEVVAYRAASAARWDLGSNALRPKYWTSADAAGLPILPGLLNYDEAASGAITHALRFTLPLARSAFTIPARHCGNHGTARSLPTYGMRFRLQSSVRARRWTGVARTIVIALKRYGLVYADQGSAMYVTGTTDPRWGPVLDQFREKPLDGSRFEVVRPFGDITVCR